MAKETVYIVQSYKAGRGKSLKAERLGPLRPAVVAFAATADTEMGDYDENPVIGEGGGSPGFPDPDLQRF